MQEIRDKKEKNKKSKKVKKTKQEKIEIKEAKRQLAEAERIKRIQAQNIRENWLKLDNAAMIYPAIGSSQWNSVFRLSVILKDKVDKEKLQQALDDSLVRYPFFNVSLRNGLFWHYFQILDHKPVIEEEKDYPCRPFEFEKREQIFRILYMENKISFESFHSLTDGGGALQFFNTLIVRYFELCGVSYKDLYKYNLNVKDLPDEEEREDAFRRFANKEKSRSRKEKVAYAVKGNLEPIQVLKVVTGLVDLGQLKEISKAHNATINEFLTAVYFVALCSEKARQHFQNNKPIKISIPVSMRRFYGSKTMRNFSQFVNMELPLDKEKAEFCDILNIVKEESKLINKDYLQGSINANVKSEKNFFVRIMPLGIKNFVLKLVYSKVGEKLFTSTLTNVGLIKLPEELNEKIEHYFVVLGATKLNRINLTANSFGNECAITFSSRLKENRIIKNYFKFLSEFGLNIKIFSN